MKVSKLLTASVLLAGSAAAVEPVINFRFSSDADGPSVEVDNVPFPYEAEGADKKCISHTNGAGKSANILDVTSNTVLQENSYCIYVFYEDDMCGGKVDDMRQMPPKGRGGYTSYYRKFKGNSRSSVVRAGPCPDEVPPLVPAPRTG